MLDDAIIPGTLRMDGWMDGCRAVIVDYVRRYLEVSESYLINKQVFQTERE